MTDLTEPLETAEKPLRGKAKTAKPGGNGRDSRKRALPEAKLLEFAELLFFAYRDFTRDPDAILRDFGFGRAHHRVLHFVTRHSGLRVADLLDVLKITKQSLGRVLKRLAAPQLIRLAEALKAAGPGADIVVRRFLQAMINAEERPKVSSIMSSSPVPDSDGNAEVS